LKKIGEYPDIIIDAREAEANFAGLAFPFVYDKINGRESIFTPLNRPPARR
jgi:tryptophan synthase beta chain